MSAIESQIRPLLFEYLLRLGDDRLILGHRLSEWCGHAPILEEDIALANIALDLIGHGALILKFAGEVEGKGRTEDDLAYLRETTEFRNVQLVEQPRGDFAYTMARQFCFDLFGHLLFQELCKSANPQLAAIAQKILKEVSYHLRHSSQWILRLGDGTAESRTRIQTAVDEVWRFTPEFFNMDNVDRELLNHGIACDLAALKAPWEKKAKEILTQGTLTVPSTSGYLFKGSRIGGHSEHLGHLLAEMQIVARSFPGASW